MSRAPDEIISSLNKAYSSLYRAIEKLEALAIRYAETERDYEVSFAQEVLRLKLDGQPITILLKLAAGNKAIAELKFDFNVATEMYKIQKAKISSYETAVNKIQSELGFVKVEYQKSTLQEG